MYKIGIWGQYGAPGEKIADGQAVRTTIITQELKNHYGNDNVTCANTNGWKKRKLIFLKESFQLVKNSEKVIIAPADRGFKVFVPLLMLINMIYHRELIYIVIGGFLPDLLHRHPVYKKMIKRFKALFVQTINLKKDLESLGIEDVYILSNPKRLNTRRKEEIHPIIDENIKVCVFSRIYTDKGVEDAIEAVKQANLRLGGMHIFLDMYGLVPTNYKERLENLLEENKDFLQYKGIVDYDKTVETLQNYFVMLFPTYYHGEGFPGNVIDAYNSALPIIATDWLYNRDVIKDKRNGILVPIKNPQAIADALFYLYNNRNEAYIYALNCLADTVLYDPDVVMKEFYQVLEKMS